MNPAASETLTSPGKARSWFRALVGLVSVAFVMGLLVLLGWGLSHVESPQPDAGVAPDFTLTSFEGKPLTLSALRGKVVVINFWASWCRPCRDEADYLEAMWRKYRDQSVVFVGVDYADINKAARRFIDEFDVSYFNGPDIGTRIASQYRTRGVPETFYVGRNGELRGMQLGPLAPPALELKIMELLADPLPRPHSIPTTPGKFQSRPARGQSDAR